MNEVVVQEQKEVVETVVQGQAAKTTKLSVVELTTIGLMTAILLVMSF